MRARGTDELAVTHLDRVIAACVREDAAEARRLVKAPQYSKFDLREEDHRTLAWVVRTGRYDAVPLLLEAGCDPTIADRDGETPLHLAVRVNSIQTMDVLLRAGAAVDALDFDAATPLDIAVSHPREAAQGSTRPETPGSGGARDFSRCKAGA